MVVGWMGRKLNRDWKVGAKHALYSRDGTFFHLLEDWPGALFDEDGYLLFKTRTAYQRYIDRRFLNDSGKRLKAYHGISSLPGYKKRRNRDRKQIVVKSPPVTIKPKEEAIAERTIGAGFGSPEQNKRVEKAAIRAATNFLELEDWRVRSVESDRLGYDLHCVKPGHVLRVKVKGVRGSQLTFVLTAGEYTRAQTDAAFALCVVTSALRIPKVLLLRKDELKAALRVVPLSYKAALRI